MPLPRRIDARTSSAKAAGLRGASYDMRGRLQGGTDEVTGAQVKVPGSQQDTLRPGPSAAWQKAFGRRPAAGVQTSQGAAGGGQPSPSPAMPSRIPNSTKAPAGAVVTQEGMGKPVVTRANPYAPTAPASQRRAVGALSLQERGAGIRSRLQAEGRLTAGGEIPANRTTGFQRGTGPMGPTPSAPTMASRASGSTGNDDARRAQNRALGLPETYSGPGAAVAPEKKVASARPDGVYDETGKRYVSPSANRTAGVYDETGKKFASDDEKRRRLLNSAGKGGLVAPDQAQMKTYG